MLGSSSYFATGYDVSANTTISVICRKAILIRFTYHTIVYFELILTAGWLTNNLDIKYGRLVRAIPYSPSPFLPSSKVCI